jgi:hypothetical protein
VALPAALLITSVGAAFDDEFVRFREELGLFELVDLRFDEALVLVLDLV